MISLCIQQLQKVPEDSADVQEQEQLRDQNIGGWIGSLGRSSLEVEKVGRKVFSHAIPIMLGLSTYIWAMLKGS